MRNHGNNFSECKQRSHIPHDLLLGIFTNSLGNGNNNYIYAISEAEKGYICNTLTESMRNQLKIKKPTVKWLWGTILQDTNSINTLLCSRYTFESDLQDYRNTQNSRNLQDYSRDLQDYRNTQNARISHTIYFWEFLQIH